MSKKLFRSQKNKIIFGVCGGLGDYFDIDPILFRLIFVFVTLVGGSGILIYFIMALIIPSQKNIKDEMGETIEKVFPKNKTRERQILGWTIIIVGLAFLFQNFFPFSLSFVSYLFWPVLLVLLGLYILLK